MSLEKAHMLRSVGHHEEARELLLLLISQSPENGLLQYEAACVHDYLGYEAEAVPFYLAAIRIGLSGEHLRSAYLGLGSTYRALGQYDQAIETFEDGLKKFPEARELRVFLAMAHYNKGNAKMAVQDLLLLLLEVGTDPAIEDYRRAITLYANDLDKTWA